MRTPVALAAVVVALSVASAANAAPAHAAAPKAGDGFAAFWATFTGALAKNDRAAAERLWQLNSLGDNPDSPKTLDQYYAANFSPAVRRCFATHKPLRDVHEGEVSYYVICDQMLYVFEKKPAGWRFTDISPDD